MQSAEVAGGRALRGRAEIVDMGDGGDVPDVRGAVAAVVREDFHWGGHLFVKGRRVLLDLYGTNHDNRYWNNPERFDPER